jgi:hypothetical protein
LLYQLTYSAHHALVADDSDCEVVDSHSMVLSAHDFWSHIPGSPTRLLCVFWVPDPRYTEVGHLQIAFLVEHQVFRLDIPVNDAFIVDVFERVDDAGDEEACLLFGESTVTSYVVPEVASLQDVQD